MGTIQLKNTEFNYEVISKVDGKRPLIIICQYCDSDGSKSFNPTKFFSKQIPMLKKYFTLIFLYLPEKNHLKNTKITLPQPDNNLSVAYTKAIHILTEHLKITQKIGLLGYSHFGGAVVQKYAMDYLNNVEFMIILNGGDLVVDTPIRNIFWNLLPQFSREHLDQVILTSFDNILKNISPFIKKTLKIGEVGLTKTEIQDFDDLIYDDIDRMIANSLEPFNILCPTLLIGAELDEYAPPNMITKLHKYIPNSAVKIVTMAGHLGLIQRYDVFNSMIIKFLKRNELL